VITGYRKFLFGVLSFTLLWVAYMWAPGNSDVIRTAVLQLQGVVFGLVIGGNVAEHFKKKSDTATTAGG
jgi:hypothetical protein